MLALPARFSGSLLTLSPLAGRYLIFSEDDVVPLSDYVFNTEAHPLPVQRS